MRFPSLKQSSNLNNVRVVRLLDLGLVVPVWKDYLHYQILLPSLLAFWMIHSQSADVRCGFGQTARFQPTHRENCADDGIFVASGYIGTGNSQLAKEQSRIWCKRSYGSLFAPKERVGDPRRRHNCYHLVARG
jgi:hypothetical protein